MGDPLPCIKLPSYVPDPDAFHDITEWMLDNPGKTYTDYKKVASNVV